METDAEMMERLSALKRGNTLLSGDIAAIYRALALIERYRGALEDLLLGGTHEGPCDNLDYDDDTGEFAACTSHAKIAEERRARARAAGRLLDNREWSQMPEVKLG